MPYSIIEPGVRKWDILQRSELDPLSNNEFADGEHNNEKTIFPSNTYICWNTL